MASAWFCGHAIWYVGGKNSKILVVLSGTPMIIAEYHFQREEYTRKSLTACQQDVFATGL
jgi:hypothetical protein